MSHYRAGSYVKLKPNAVEGMLEQHGLVLSTPDENNGIYMVRVVEADRHPDDVDGLVEVPPDCIEYRVFLSVAGEWVEDTPINVAIDWKKRGL